MCTRGENEGWAASEGAALHEANWHSALLELAGRGDGSMQAARAVTACRKPPVSFYKPIHRSA